MTHARMDLGRPARRLRRRLVLCALLGGLTAAGLAPLGWWWLAMPALAALIWVLSPETGWRAATAQGWFAGAGYFAAGMFWIVNPFLIDVQQDGWMAPFALVLMSFGMALFWALAAGLAVPLGRDRRGRALAFAVLLAATALLRTYILTGFPWNLVGHIWIGAWPDQVAALVGAVGLTLMTTLAAAAPAAFGLVRGAIFACALLGAAGGYGLWRLDQPIPAPAHPGIVRLVQPNATQSLKWQPDLQREFFRRLLEQTALPGTPKPDLVVWPETSVPFLLNRAGQGLQLIASAANGASVALGIQRTEADHAYNSLAVIDPTGNLTHTYDKHHLVPFGEYVPLGDLLYQITGIPDYAPSLGYGYTPGPGAAVLDLGPLGTVLPLICYEAVFPQDVSAAPRRADWMLQVTDDAWFGVLSGPFQHLAQARLRAIEQGLPLLRDANTGVSAVVDARGRVLQSLPMLAEGHIDAAIPGALPPTPYSRTGDTPIAVLLLALAFGLFQRRRRIAH